MTVTATKFDRPIKQTIFDLTADYPTTGKECVNTSLSKIEDCQADRPFIAETIPVIEHEHGVLVAFHETREIGDLVAARCEIELVGFLRHLRRADQPIAVINADRAFNAEFGQIGIEIKAGDKLLAGLVGAVL